MFKNLRRKLHRKKNPKTEIPSNPPETKILSNPKEQEQVQWLRALVRKDGPVWKEGNTYYITLDGKTGQPIKLQVTIVQRICGKALIKALKLMPQEMWKDFLNAVADNNPDLFRKNWGSALEISEEDNNWQEFINPLLKRDRRLIRYDIYSQVDHVETKGQGEWYRINYVARYDDENGQLYIKTLPPDKTQLIKKCELDTALDNISKWTSPPSVLLEQAINEYLFANTLQIVTTHPQRPAGCPRDPGFLDKSHGSRGQPAGRRQWSEQLQQICNPLDENDLHANLPVLDDELTHIWMTICFAGNIEGKLDELFKYSEKCNTVAFTTIAPFSLELSEVASDCSNASGSGKTSTNPSSPKSTSSPRLLDPQLRRVPTPRRTPRIRFNSLPTPPDSARSSPAKSIGASFGQEPFTSPPVRFTSSIFHPVAKPTALRPTNDTGNPPPTAELKTG